MFVGSSAREVPVTRASVDEKQGRSISSSLRPLVYVRTCVVAVLGPVVSQVGVSMSVFAAHLLLP
eukprot:14348969-Alexandrium_andersonii.AAC.1